MVKRKINSIEKLVVLYFIAFPFGHFFTFRANILGREIPFNFSDLISFCFLIYFLIKKIKQPFVFNYLKNFLLLALFSQTLFILIHGVRSSFIGNLYLLRIFSYSAMFAVIWNFLNKNKKLKSKIIDYFIAVFFFIAVFSWLQYLFYPDMRAFTVWGWDDHLYRIVGTFIDPTFTAIFLVFGVILSLAKFQKTKKNIYVLALLLILTALFFTYSRAGYISLIAGILTFLAIKKRIKVSFIIIPLFILSIFFLPRPSSEGVHLERTYSVNARIQNYFETARIFLNNPIFGIGYNNICWARQEYLYDYNYNSHSCSGSDSGILLLLATTGIVGFFIFSSFIYMLIKSVGFDFNGTVFLSCFSALLVHSQFSNSIFYPWVMGVFVFLSSISLKE